MRILIPLAAFFLASCSATKKTGLIRENGKIYASEIITIKGSREMRCYLILTKENGRFYFVKNGNEILLYKRQPRGSEFGGDIGVQ